MKSKKFIFKSSIPVSNSLNRNPRIIPTDLGEEVPFKPNALKIPSFMLDYLESRRPKRKNAHREEIIKLKNEEEHRIFSEQENSKIASIKWISVEETEEEQKKIALEKKIKELQKQNEKYKYSYFKNQVKLGESWKKTGSWRNGKEITEKYYEKKEVKFINDLVQQNANESALILQKYVNIFIAKKKLKKLKKKRRKRKRILQEIVQTEREYIHHLRICEAVFLIPLKELSDNNSPLISKSEYRHFVSFRSIKNVNITFLNELEKAVTKDWDEIKSIGKIFLKICPFFKMYRSYVTGYQKLINLWKDIKRRSDIFKKWEKDPRTTRLGLISYLICPVSRIPRYRLLLRDLIKNSEEEHGDFFNLLAALDGVTKIADFLDSGMRICQNMDEMKYLFDRLIGYNKALLIPNRKIYCQESVRFGFVLQKKKYIILFNDMFMVCSNENTSSKNRMIAFECIEDISSATVLLTNDARYKGKVIRLCTPRKDILMFFNCSSTWGFKEWIKKLQLFIKNNGRKIWPPDTFKKLKNHQYIDCIINLHNYM